MKTNHMKSILFIITVSLLTLGTASSLSARSMSEVKSAMISRQAGIEALLLSQEVGENNKGLLETFKTLSEASAKLVEDENKDRQTVYSAIGKKSGASAAVVGSSRASDIRKRAKSGIKVQLPGGEWVVSE